MAVMWITHDLGIMAEMAQNINVMYAGFIIERGNVHEILPRRATPTRSSRWLTAQNR